MIRSLSENIVRGRRAVDLANQRGLDTVLWEEHLATLEHQALLAWASELADRDLELPQSITYGEASFREVITTRVSYYAAHYLWMITYARLQQRAGGWGGFTSKWWNKCEEQAFCALSALRNAMNIIRMEGAEK